MAFNKNFAVTENLAPEFSMRDLHSIMFYDRKIWATCTFENMVAIYDTKSRNWEKWFPSPYPDARHADINHYNTLAINGDYILLVSHNKGASDIAAYSYPSSTWYRPRGSGIMLMIFWL